MRRLEPQQRDRSASIPDAVHRDNCCLCANLRIASGLKLTSRPGTPLLGVKWSTTSLTGVTVDRRMSCPFHRLIKRESQSSGRVANLGENRHSYEVKKGRIRVGSTRRNLDVV